MLSHLEEKVVDSYRSDKKKEKQRKEKIYHVMRKKTYNSDNALQIEATF